MITLGNITHSIPSVARRARSALTDSGRMAVYVGTTGEAVAIGYAEREYGYQLRRQERHLVGVYDDDLQDNDGFSKALIGSIRAHVTCRKVAA